jgi:hypothetical protein
VNPKRLTSLEQSRLALKFLGYRKSPYGNPEFIKKVDVDELGLSGKLS